MNAPVSPWATLVTAVSLPTSVLVALLGTAIGGMGGPNGLAITPDGSTAWVADDTGGKVWQINNLKTTPTLGTAVTGMTASGPAVCAFGKRG